ncbi:MAG: shikimate dehydrogenase [Methylomonas sp.]|nr:shikimate dehydrogenase [Methylomonas sp.]PPD20235.1 MAG: shikimate dehydrogenase [Methylomonas sp.]PPD24006.1 MAG: shikimate dehydrogenase [Methylomonas sp.]PPD32281.1 MAG: shikimate dehydrogenase [Methylomonas sp.]PPD40347.1 MAG: shikimate dehydrogenase [Methylomonas sp.]
MTIDHYAVFGHPIKHSKSPLIHRLFAEQTGQPLIYTAEDVPQQAFAMAIERFFLNGGRGLNCTLPLKELAWQTASHLTPRAQRAKAVNTLTLQADNTLLGDNTDGIGLLNDLTHNHGIAIKNQRILILGAGGATRGIIAPLLDHGATNIVIANRTPEKAHFIAQEFQDLGDVTGCGYPALENQRFDLLINATSASLSGDLPPLPPKLLRDNASCYDLAYADRPTAFMDWSHRHGARLALDGLGMLAEQAAEAFYIWRNIRPETATVIAYLNQQRQHGIPS